GYTSWPNSWNGWRPRIRNSPNGYTVSGHRPVRACTPRPGASSTRSAAASPVTSCRPATSRAECHSEPVAEPSARSHEANVPARRQRVKVSKGHGKSWTQGGLSGHTGRVTIVAGRQDVKRLVYVDNLKVLLVAWIIGGHGLLGYAAIGGWPYDEVNEVTLSPRVELILAALLGPSALFV